MKSNCSKLYYILSFLLCIILYNTSFSQVKIKNNGKIVKYYPEFRLGFNQLLLSGEGFHNQSGFGFGLYNQWYRHEHFNLVGGFSINQNNSEVDLIFVDSRNYFEGIKYKVNTLGFPVLIRGNIGKPFTLFFETGAMPNLTLSNNGKGDHHYVVYRNGKWINYYEQWNKKTDHFKAFDLDIVVGAGIKIPDDNIDFSLGTTLNYGVIDIHKYNNDYRNFFVQVYLGIGIR